MRAPKVCVFAAVILGALSANAATFTVVTINDSGAGSLRQAIADANAAPSDDTIAFNLPRPSQITLTSALPAVTGNLSIVNEVRDINDFITVARSGASEYRIFTLTPGSSVSMSGLIIFGGGVPGDFGGGILNDKATLSLNRCALVGNTAGAGGGIYNRQPAQLIATDCAFNNNNAIALGGAIIHESGERGIVLDRCEVSNNNGDGAGVVTGGPSNIQNCTFDNNTSNPGRAGAIMVVGSSANVAVINCTLSENSASAAGGAGGVFLGSGAQMNITNTIAKRGSTGTNLAIGPGGGFITSGGSNLSDDAANGDSGSGPGGFLPSPGDRRNTDPQLGPLGNFGNVTRSRAPLPGSLAIDSGNDAVLGSPFVLNHDQRGVPRPIGPHVDIGSVEVDIAQTAPAFEVNTIDEHNDGLCGIGDCTLWEAIDRANSSPGSNVSFRAGVVGTITNRRQPAGLPINAAITISGPGARLLTVSGERVSRVFNVAPGLGIVAISGLVLTNGFAPGGPSGDSGGAIWNRSDLRLSYCTLNSSSAVLGGAIYNDGRGGDARATINSCTVLLGSALRGGAIYNDASSGGSKARLEIANSTLTDNSATATGGAIHNNGNFGGEAIVILTSDTFSASTAPAGGGSIYNEADFGTGTVSLGNTILNIGSSGTTLVNHSGAITSLGTNLTRDAAGGDATTGPGGLLNASGDIRNTDSLLGALANNGGPTDTLALLAGSPAIDAGNNSLASGFDQRVFGRNGLVDIGAFEFRGLLPVTLANISTRLRVETGDNALIAGFILTGSDPKKVIIRAIGPSLGLPGQLSNPTLELYQGSTLLASNDDWQNQAPAERQPVLDSTIPPSNDLESALVRTLPASGTTYTAVMRGVSNGTGIGVVEAYDLDLSANSKLANISTRGLVQTGDNVLIAGTILVGSQNQKVIVRAIGPSLPLAGRLENPTLELRDQHGALLEENDNWMDSPNRQAIIDSGIPPANDLESAIVRTLPSTGANYTAIVRGVGATSGIAVVEVYALN
jgi:hypothetical protein